MRAAPSLLALLLVAACAQRPPARPEGPAVGSDFVSPIVGHDAELSTYAYPEPVVLHAFDSQRQPLRMAFLDVRPASPNGRVVLLLHGKNFNASYWAETARALAARGFRVVAPDQAGSASRRSRTRTSSGSRSSPRTRAISSRPSGSTAAWSSATRWAGCSRRATR
jgi:pimeloyl-ACP methyl ester carboxylesterase